MKNAQNHHVYKMNSLTKDSMLTDGNTGALDTSPRRAIKSHASQLENSSTKTSIVCSNILLNIISVSFYILSRKIFNVFSPNLRNYYLGVLRYVNTKPRTRKWGLVYYASFMLYFPSSRRLKCFLF